MQNNTIARVLEKLSPTTEGDPVVILDGEEFEILTVKKVGNKTAIIVDSEGYFKRKKEQRIAELQSIPQIPSECFKDLDPDSPSDTAKKSDPDNENAPVLTKDDLTNVKVEKTETARNKEKVKGNKRNNN
jgi:hypothetical protein